VSREPPRPERSTGRGIGFLAIRAALNYSLGVRSIFLIRHGETIGNAARVVQHPDDPLSPRGLAQAERLARRLASEGVTAILSSDYARARSTAESLQRQTGVPLVFEPLLQERNFGDLRGMPYSEIGFDMFSPDYAPPNGESWPVFHARVDRAWARVQHHLAATTGGHLAVVTHGLVCRSLAARHLTLPDGVTVPERWENTSLTVIEPPAPWRVGLLNCIAHLDDLDVAARADSGAV
jgi:broad specificity phosphatase PhoE